MIPHLSQKTPAKETANLSIFQHLPSVNSLIVVTPGFITCLFLEVEKVTLIFNWASPMSLRDPSLLTITTQLPKNRQLG